MAISTIYEVSKPTYQFYAVERSGYTDVAALVTDTLTDMTKDGKFEFKSTYLIDENDFVMRTPDFPILERLIRMAAPGLGYKANTELEVPLAIGSNIKITVSNVIQTTGEIKDFKIKWPGNYETPTVTDVPVFYATNNLPFSSDAMDYANVSITTALTLQGNVSNSIGFVTPPADPTENVPYDADSKKKWETEYGADGTGGTKGGKRPTVGIWFEVDISSGKPPATPKTPSDYNLYVGQLVELNKSKSNSANSVIPPGTTIVSINPMTYVTGLARQFPNTSQDGYYVVIKSGIYLTLSNPVTLRFNDNIAFKGTGFRISNSQTQPATAWTAIVEAQGAVDPINDPLGVTGDIRVSGTNSEYIEITSISNQPNVPYSPKIYEGQSVTSTQLNGSIGPGELVYVSEVTTNGPGTIANVRLSRPLSNFTAGETLQFRFDQLQPWRLAFEVKKTTVKSNVTTVTGGKSTTTTANVVVPSQQLVVYAATDVQLQDNGNISSIQFANYSTTGTFINYVAKDRSGIMGAQPTATGYANIELYKTDSVIPTPNVNIPTQGFINRAARVGSHPAAYPFNYALTMTDRGIFWGVWEGTWSTMQKTKAIGANGDSFFNWFLVQRPVNRNTGKVLTKGRAPVFCINSVGYQYWKFIVREEDVLHPSAGDPENKRQRWIFANSTITSDNVPYRVPADTNTQDSFAILNTANQVALTEDSKYLVSFLHNLSTPRFRYSEELDMIGQTSADVCMAGTDVSIAAYSESGARTYRALPANNPYNTGLRIAVLRDIPQVEP
jgi:hypothetical protein